MYVSMSLYDRVVMDHSCRGMTAYAGEWHERGSWSYGESSRKSSLEKLMRSVSCGYELTLCAYNMPMCTLWVGNVERYISGMKTT